MGADGRLWINDGSALLGLTGSGKSAVAYALERRLFDEGKSATVLDGLGLPAPAELDGRSLAAALRGKPLRDEPVFAASIFRNQETTVRLGRWKVVHTPPGPSVRWEEDAWDPFYATTDSHALYDVELDPSELFDRAEGEPDRLRELARLLEAWEQEHGFPTEARNLPAYELILKR